MVIKKVRVDLERIDFIEEFIQDMNSFRSDINAMYGTINIDAKSFLAIVALGKPEFYIALISSDPEEVDRFCEVVNKYEI